MRDFIKTCPFYEDQNVYIIENKIIIKVGGKNVQIKQTQY